jgi:hypothetical protein
MNASGIVMMTRTIAAVAISLVCWNTAFGQAAAPATPAPPAADKPDAKAPPANQSGKSLDDLLGIDKDQQNKGAAEAAQRDSDEALKRELSEKEIADNFALAVEKMSLSAELLDTKFDPGLGTQRVQEDIISKLDQLIQQCRNKQCKGGGSSSSSSAPQQAKNNPKNDPGNKPQAPKPNPPGNQRNPKPSDSREGAEPPLQEGDINTVIEESRTEWGNLPPRVRDAIQQARRGKFSSLYSQLTAEYYKRLAEENSP